MRERHEGTRKWRLPNCALHRRSHALPASRVPPSRGPCIVPTPTRRPSPRAPSRNSARGRPTTAERDRIVPPLDPRAHHSPRLSPRCRVIRTSQPKRYSPPTSPISRSRLCSRRFALAWRCSTWRDARMAGIRQGSVALIVAYHEAATRFSTKLPNRKNFHLSSRWIFSAQF